jgi:hypothetical protein
MIKNLTWSQCTQSKALPVLMDIHDMIKYHVNKEAETTAIGYNLPIPTFIPNKLKMTPASLVGLAGTMIKAFVP